MDIYGGIRMINPIELSNDTLYFADEKYMSVSAFKRFQKCEVGALSDWGEPSDAMKVGSYVDSYISGILNEYKAEHPEIISSRGASKGQLKSEFKKAEEICRFIDNDATLSQFLGGEKQVVMTGEVIGIPFKIKIDSYCKGIAINDLKCMRTVTDSKGEYYDFVTQWGYNIQLAMYQEIVLQNTGEKLPCYICAVTKETPINSVIINIPQFMLDKALYEVTESIKRYYDIKMLNESPQGCGICPTCIANRTDTQIISLQDILEGGSY